MKYWPRKVSNGGSRFRSTALEQTFQDRALTAFLLVSLLLPPVSLGAQTFSGKCVGVSDGDTIKVLRDGREAKVRLEGIDCPESGEPFSAKGRGLRCARLE